MRPEITATLYPITTQYQTLTEAMNLSKRKPIARNLTIKLTVKKMFMKMFSKTHFSLKLTNNFHKLKKTIGSRLFNTKMKLWEKSVKLSQNIQKAH
jgi:midasin (ATPase involved in ribosome maturation)